jgi:hypothetical protein
MANIAKRMTRKLAKHLGAGEEPIVAILVEPRGTYGFGMFATVAAPRTATRKLTERVTGDHGADGGMAECFPGEASVIMVTNRRVLVAPSNGLKVGDPAFEVPLGSVLVRSVSSKGLGKRVELILADGSGVAVDAGRMQPFDLFTETLGSTP